MPEQTDLVLRCLHPFSATKKSGLRTTLNHSATEDTSNKGQLDGTDIVIIDDREEADGDLSAAIPEKEVHFCATKQLDFTAQ